MLDFSNWQTMLTSFIVAIFTAVVTGVTVLIRKILTNEKMIAVLESQVDRQEELLTEMRADIKKLLSRVE